MLMLFFVPLKAGAQGWFDFSNVRHGRHDVKAAVKLVPDKAMTGHPCRFVFEVEVPDDVNVEGVNIRGLPNPENGIEYDDDLHNLADGKASGTNRVVKRFALPVRFLKPQTIELDNLFVEGMLTTRRHTGSMSFTSSSNFAKRLNPLTVVIDDLPEHNRPLNFSGAIGTRFKISQTVKPNRVHPGDLLTVTYTLEFDGYCPTNFFPVVNRFSKEFRTYEPKLVSRTENSIMWTQLIVPQTIYATNTALTAVNYFNIANRRYEAVYAYPQKLEFISDKEAVKENQAVVIDTDVTKTTSAAVEKNPSAEPLILYFVPKETSPVLAKLPPDSGYKVLSRSGAWKRVETEKAIGWIKR